MYVKSMLKVSFCCVIRMRLAPNVELGKQNTHTGKSSHQHFGAHGYLSLHFATCSIRGITKQHFPCEPAAFMAELVCSALVVVEAVEFEATCIAAHATLPKVQLPCSKHNIN